jgi:uncharacterized protein
MLGRARWVSRATTWLARGLGLLVLLVSLVLASHVLAAPPAPSAPASPTSPSVEVPPSPTRWVSDRAGVLSPATQQQLDRRLQAYERDTGHQVIVWIGHSTGDVPIETFAVEAFEAWRLGQANLDDGLAVFAMVEDRTIRIEVGYGLEPTVTDLIAARVIREIMIPGIEAADWDRAMVAGVEALIGTIEGRADALGPAPAAGTPGTEGAAEGAPEATGPPEPPWLGTAKIIGMVILVIGFVILLIVNPRLALLLLFFVGRGGGRGGGGGFGGGGGRSGGGGATGRW